MAPYSITVGNSAVLFLHQNFHTQMASIAVKDNNGYNEIMDIAK